MTNFAQAINQLPREFRVPVAQAISLSDGSWPSLESEIRSLTWVYPDLPVDQILVTLR